MLFVVVPLQGALSLQLKARGPSHAHLSVDAVGGWALPPTPAQPEGFEWASSSRLRTTPSIERVRAALRGKAHGSLNGFKWFASRGGAGVEIHASAHAEAHSERRRHHHGPAVSTVVLDPLDALDPARESPGAQAQSMAWATPGQNGFLRAAAPPGAPVPLAIRQWHNHVPSPPERPPRIRDEARAA